MPTILLIAYHFPPVAGSSGLQRTLRFAQYLPEFGWQPIVLTVESSAHEQIDERSVQQIPETCEVIRTRCVDVGRALSFAGRYPRMLALPDRWASWQLSAVPTGRRLARQGRIDALWSTYPIATAHRIGARLAQATRLPWIADFRDPMAQEGYPPEPRRWRSFKRVEEEVMADAARMVFVSPSALELYQQRYPAIPAERFVLLPNGFDEQSFAGLSGNQSSASRADVPVLLHSGIVYPEERDPHALFEALGRLKRSGVIRPGDFVLRFRAPVHAALLEELGRRHEVGAFIEVQPQIPYREALKEMLDAQALVIMQGSNCNEQIPAKLYEYLRAGRPLLPLADPAGDTGRLITRLGYPYVTKLESADALVETLPDFVRDLKARRLPVARSEIVEQYSRRMLTRQLADMLDELHSTKGRQAAGDRTSG